MDTRFPAPNLNQVRDFQVFYHPISDIEGVRIGTATDGIEWTSMVKSGSQSTSETSVTLVWNHTFDNFQPAYGTVLEIRVGGVPLWIGVITSISSLELQAGKKQMTVTARSRETQDNWKLTKLVTNLYPQGTNLGAIINEVAVYVGLYPDEVIVPPTSVVTMHSNTQLSNIPAWQMMQDLFFPLGLTPAINSVGQLTGISRQLQNRTPDYVLTDQQFVRLKAQRQRPPTSRYILNWLDPNLTKVVQQGRKLATATMTSGFFLPYLYHDVFFSDDETQRAENTYLHVKQSANALGIPVCLETYEQLTENKGQIKIISLGFTQALMTMALAIQIAATKPDGVVVGGFGASTGFTIPTGRIAQAVGEVSMFLSLMLIGTGIYEVWGNPYDWKHAKNTTEAYDTSGVQWLDNPETVECDLIMNESHADAIAVQELIYLARSASKTDTTIVDDLRMEKGDIVQFADGTKFYVENFTRSLTRGTAATLELQGFLI